MVTRGRTSAQASAGRRGRRTLRFARGRAAAGACPSSGPAGPPSPKGEGKGGGGRSRRGGGTPPYVWGDMETLWGLREQSFPGRRAVGAGHARPGGLRRQASMVRSVGRGLDPSAGGCPGDGCWCKPPRGVGDAAPTVCPGMGGSGSLPLIRPCGAAFPRGGRQELLLAAAGARPLPRQLVLGAELEGQAVVPAV